MFSSENLSDSRTAATESEGQLWNLWWDFPFLKEKKGPCQKPWWTPRVKKTSHQYFFKQAIFPGCGKKFQRFFGTEPWGPVDLPEDFWQGHLAELIDGRQTKVGVSGVAIHHLFKTKQQLRMLVRMYGKNSQNSKHPNLDAKLDIVCVTRSISEIFRCLSIFAYLCSGITIFHQFVIFKDQQLRQWKAKKRHIHTTNLDGKNLQVTSFHFEAERPTFGYLRTCGKGRHVGQRCTSWCSAHCGPWKKQKYAKREWKSIWQRKWFRKLWCTMVENLGNRQLVWEVGETFERCVFLMERVESVFGLFVIFYLNSRRFAVRWYVGLRQWTSR